MTEAQDEKELILGNKQLISLFFVVVALCGVCFAMGYIIGHNASKPGAAPDTAQAQQQPVPAAHAQDSETPRDASPVPGESASPVADSSQSAQPAPAPDSPSPVATQPGRDVPAPQPAAETAPPPAAVSEPQPGGGSYLQVSAVSKPDAENLVRTLREQSLPALMAESPKKGLYRVLVGPYRQTSELADAKSKLKTLGFDNAFVQK